MKNKTLFSFVAGTLMLAGQAFALALSVLAAAPIAAKADQSVVRTPAGALRESARRDRLGRLGRGNHLK